MFVIPDPSPFLVDRICASGTISPGEFRIWELGRGDPALWYIFSYNEMLYPQERLWGRGAGWEDKLRIPHLMELLFLKVQMIEYWQFCIIHLTYVQAHKWNMPALRAREIFQITSSEFFVCLKPIWSAFPFTCKQKVLDETKFTASDAKKFSIKRRKEDYGLHY